MNWIRLQILHLYLHFKRGGKYIFFLSRTVTLHKNGKSATIRFQSSDDFSIYEDVFLKEHYKVDVDARVIVDLGANIGISVAYFYLNYDAHIYAVEPNPLCVNLLRATHIPITIEECAIGERDGTAELHLMSNHHASSSLLERQGATQTITVSVKSLETLLSKIPRVDILKVDIEGMEGAVANSPAMQKVRFAIFEVHPDLASSSLLPTIPLSKGRFIAFVKGGY